tara:strand:- start:4365 stop:5255 length:891 start_codon:yes stop_codon:yes gene_type:complete
MIKEFTVCLSVNDNYAYYKNLPIVYMSWKSFFPKCKVFLGFVHPKIDLSNRDTDEELISFLKQHCDELVILDEIGGIPTENQGKFLRYFVASERPKEEICLIHDIDSLPLQSEYWNMYLFEHIEKNKLLAVGYDVYINTENEGKFPASNLIATAEIFKKLVNPKNLSYQSLIFTYCGIRNLDEKERIDQIKQLFSDESLVRYMIINNLGMENVNHIDRKINIQTQWLDKVTWSLNIKKLQNGGYIECNLPRNFDVGCEKINTDELFDFIKINYLKTKKNERQSFNNSKGGRTLTES